MASSIAQLVPISQGPADHITIFIHGYLTASGDKNTDQVMAWINRLGLSGDVYLLNWRAGSWQQPAWVQAAASLSHTAYRVYRWKRWVSPLALAGDAALYTLNQAAHFKFFEQRTKRIAQDLKALIAPLPNLQERRIHLIGHSLGARIICHALSQEHWHDFRLHDCLLLAGAADLHHIDWAHCLAQINGQLYNAYSKRDMILNLTPDLKQKIGHHPLPLESARIINRRYSYGHNDFLTKLDQFLPELWDNYHSQGILSQGKNILN